MRTPPCRKRLRSEIAVVKLGMYASAIARSCAEAMWPNDVSSRMLPIELIFVEPGCSEVLALMASSYDSA